MDLLTNRNPYFQNVNKYIYAWTKCIVVQFVLGVAIHSSHSSGLVIVLLRKEYESIIMNLSWKDNYFWSCFFIQGKLEVVKMLLLLSLDSRSCNCRVFHVIICSLCMMFYICASHRYEMNISYRLIKLVWFKLSIPNFVHILKQLSVRWN